MNTSFFAPDLLSFLPPAVARAVCSRKLSAKAPRQGAFPAAVLFSDISGFTVLTGKLAEHGSAGAEELTILLNRYFSRMIDLLEQEGGEVVQFSGDAMMVVFPCPDPSQLPGCVRHAWQAGLQMQRALQDQFARLETSVGEVELGMKVSIGAGTVQEYYLGGVQDRWYYLIAGDPLAQVAEAEHHASRGDVVLSPEAQALFIKQPVPLLPVEASSPAEISGETLAAVRSFAPEVITRRLEAGQSEWLAEIRRLTVLFFSVQGLRYGAEDVLEQAQRWMETLLQTVYHCGGTLNKLLVDDKGTIGIALFGAPPLSHEDDPLRAVRCAIQLNEAAEAQGLKIYIGLTTGWVFAGPVGGQKRREYTVMGDGVNLAARLMQSAAKAGRGIRSDASTYRASQAEIEWEELPREVVKGFAAPVEVFRPVAFSQARATNFISQRTSIIGREREYEQLGRWVAQAFDGQSQVVLIDSEPGMGRERLLTELLFDLHDQNVAVWLDRVDPLAEKTAYNAWSGIFRSYFGVRGLPLDKRRDRVCAQLEKISPGLLARAPLLNDLLGLDLPDSDLTAHLSPRLRQASLESLLLDLVDHWIAKYPLLIAIEEAQWLDSLSWQLILQIARSFSDLPLLIVLTAQTPADFVDTAEKRAWAQLQFLKQFKRLTLNPLEDASIVRLSAAALGVQNLPAELVRLIVTRAAGNPLVAEQIVATLSDSGILQVKDGNCEIIGYLNAARVPDTLHGLVLNKIDQLEADQQLTLKVASVIGRTFGYRTLHDVYPLPLEKQQLLGQLDSLGRKGLIHPMLDDLQLHSHAFRQAIFQEVTYQTVLPSQSRDLHARIARWYETYMEQAGEQSSLYPLLAYHWRQAKEPERELFFATKAGRKLIADYANNEALSFLDRALQLEQDPARRYDLLELRLRVLERLGNRAAQRENLQQLQSLLDTCAALRPQQARLSNAWADYYHSQAQYAEAQEALRLALECARQVNDQASEARSLMQWGWVLEHQAMFAEARDYFNQALAINRSIGARLGEAETLSRLSSVARSLGELEVARDAELHALELRRGLGDRANETISLINLALIAQDLRDSETAWKYRQEALEVTRAVGDRAAEALNMNNIGWGYLLKGDYAGAQTTLEQALRLHRTMGDRYREAECQNILGSVCRDLGKPDEARDYFEKAAEIQEAIGDTSDAAYTYLNLGYILLGSDPQRGKQYFETALQHAVSTGSREVEGYAYAYLGLYHERVQDWERARNSYETALPIRRELQAWASMIEDTAGLARIALAQGDIATAREYAGPCWNHLQTQGADGMEFPVRVYLTCYDVYHAAGEAAAARQILEAAHQLLLSRAGPISDPASREGMLHNVPENQRVVELCFMFSHPAQMQ